MLVVMGWNVGVHNYDGMCLTRTSKNFVSSFSLSSSTMIKLNWQT